MLFLNELISFCSYWESAFLLSSFKQLIPWINNPSSKSISILSNLKGVLFVLEICAINLSFEIGELSAGSGITFEVTLKLI